VAFQNAKTNSYTRAKDKLKKPKDLPKSPVNKGNVSPMIAPNLYAQPSTLPAITPRATFDPGQQIRQFTDTELPNKPAAYAAYDAALAPAATDPGGFGKASNTAGSGGYTPAAIASGYLNDNPDVIAADVLASAGITNPDVIDLMADLVQYGLPMELLTRSGQSGFAPSGAESTNFLTQFAQNMMTPGGAMPDVDTLMGAIMNADPNSALGAFLATQGPDGVNNLIRAAMRMGTSNPYFTAGMDKQLDQMDLGYRQDFAHGAVADPDAYYQAVRSGNLGKYF